MSNDINNNWIEAIKNKADNATRQVPEGTWEAIASALPKQAPKLKQRAISTKWWKGIAAAATVAIVVATGVMVYNANDEQQPVPLAQQIKKPKRLYNKLSKC